MKLRQTHKRIIRKVNYYLTEIEKTKLNSPERRRIFYETFSYLASVKDWVYKHEKLLRTVREKLLYLVVIDRWDMGRDFYKYFELNTIIECNYIISTFTGLDTFS